jgi:Tfp pilus assembly protein PilX
MRKLKRFFAREDGIALATVVCMISVLTILSVALIDQVTSESSRSAAAVKSDAVYQAAEAGINDYIAKLLDDPQYYDHFVANGEATRTSCTTYANGVCTGFGSLVVGPGQAWTTGTHWGYTASAPNNKDTWYTGTGNTYGNSTVLKGYAYDLMITPPSPTLGTDYVTILSTGCKLVSGGTTCDTSSTTGVSQRSIEVRARRTTPADFQFMWPGNVSYGDDATTYGTIYAAGTINHSGVAYGNLESEVGVTGSPDLRNGATIYTPSTNPSIRTVVTSPIFPTGNLSNNTYFAYSLTDTKRAAATNSPSTDFEDSSASAWRFNFTQSGTVQVWRCINSSTPQTSQPYCNDVGLSNNVTLKSSTSTTVPVNGSTTSFPNSGTIYIGPTSGGRIDTVTYSGTSGNSFTGVKCTSSSNCGSGITHSTGETVSIVSGGLPGPVPAYNGPIPSNGAFYTGQDAIVSWPDPISGYSSDGSSTVNGRVTLATNADVVIGGDIYYNSDPAHGGGPNDDVLGLIANSDVWMATWSPDGTPTAPFEWRAATIAETGTWSSAASCSTNRASGSTLIFIGSTTAQTAGCATDFDNRTYASDDGSYSSTFSALKYLFPPWYPVIDGMETTMLFDEVPSSTTLPVG